MKIKKNNTMATKTVAQDTKTVAVYNSANNSLVEITIPSTVSTRSQLETHLDKNDISHSNTTMIIGETTTGLVSPDSLIPEGNFTLMLSPKKVKSGVTGFKTASYAEMKQYIRQQASRNVDKVRQHFGNYTQLSTDRMRSLIASFAPSKMKVSVPQKSVVSKKASAPVKKSVATKPVSSQNQKLVSSLKSKLAKVDTVCCKR